MIKPQTALISRAVWVVVVVLLAAVIVLSLLFWSAITGLQSAQNDLAQQIFELRQR